MPNGAQQSSQQICSGSQKPRWKCGWPCAKGIIKALHKFLNDSGELEAECIGNKPKAGKGKGLKSLWFTDL